MVDEEITLSLKDHINLNKRVALVKTKRWMAIPNDIIGHPDFYKISGDQIKVYLWIMSVFSKTNKETIRVHVGLCMKDCEVNEMTVRKTIEKLNTKRWHVLSKCSTSAQQVPDEHSSRQKKHSRIEENRIEERRREKSREDVPDAPKSAVDPTTTSVLRKLRIELHNQVHGCDPEDNAQSNSFLGQLIKAVGDREAPLVLRYFYMVPNNHYRKNAHALKLLLYDKAKLITEVRRQSPIIPDARANTFKKATHYESIKEEILRKARESDAP